MILDTNALSALLDGDAGLEFLDAYPELMLPVIVLGEHRFGLFRSKFRDRLETELDRLLTRARVLPIDEETARHYAGIREELRQAGKPIPHSDFWIAALARQHGLEVASQDRHFDRVKGLRRRGW